MKKIGVALGVMISAVAIANDGGVYSVQPYHAKLEKSQKYMSFTGQYAEALMKILPPQINVVTTLNPAIKSAYNKNFRAVWLKDDKGLGVFIDCSSAEIEMNGTLPVVKPAPETRCAIHFVDGPAEFGDEQKLPVKEALKKADEANHLK